VLIDGHNRLAIAEKLGIEYTTRELSFESEDEAKAWIIRNQFGRRNINNYQRSVLALKLEDIYRERAKKNQVRTSENRVLQKSAEQKVDTRDELAKTAKVSHDTISKVKKIEAEAPEEVKQKLNSGEISINKAFSEVKKSERKKEIAKQKEDIRQGKIELPVGEYDLIVIDPPWAYETNYDPDGRRGACPYPLMSQEELKNINMPAANDCILWLWTTHRFIWDAKDLMDHWGFEYKAALIWDKEKMGIGTWVRMQVEFCLLGIKGKPLWDVTDMRDIMREPRREHSRKPDVFYKLIDENFVGRKLDYFSREHRNGWTLYGNDTGKF
jgi:N6-adenosine-specific RNA methylase IME4